MVKAMNTRELLEQVTDSGKFEVLATGVLRVADGRYRSLSHPGVNSQGKTVASPVDGIGVTRNDTGQVLTLTAHTISGRHKLRGKWLAGDDSDWKKALSIINEERKRKSFKQAIVVLTCNCEPAEKLLRDVYALSSGDIEIDVWTGSRIASFLDNDPEGQWLRSQAFGSTPQRLSLSLLKEISATSIERNCPPFNPSIGVERIVDGALANFSEASTGIGFVFGESGQGKSVACWHLAKKAIVQGKQILFLSDKAVERFPTLEQALTHELQAIAPSLSDDCGREALALTSGACSLLLIVEDANDAANPEKLLQRLLQWQKPPTDGTDRTPITWRLLCPLWQSTAAIAEPRIRDKVVQNSMTIEGFRRSEAIEAIQKKASEVGRSITKVEANSLAIALGDDPLLIALNEDSTVSSNEDVIRTFVEHHLNAAADSELLTADLSLALRQLMHQVVLGRKLTPDWASITSWFESAPDHLRSLRKILSQGRIIRLEQDGENHRLAYRHDRVRDHLISQALLALSASSSLPDVLLADPFYAELFGVILHKLPEATVSRVAECNPAAIFSALKQSDIETDLKEKLLGYARTWMQSEEFTNPARQHQRYHAIELLSQTDGEFVAAQVGGFKDSHWGKIEALLRNGDVEAGIRLCRSSDPGVQHSWRDRLIEHSLAKFPHIRVELAKYLEDPSITNDGLYGALNFAGEIGDPQLVKSLEKAWFHEPTPERISGAWIWAALMCFDGSDSQLLDSLCQVWASLPEKEEREGENKRDNAPRWDLVGHALPFALARKPHESAIDYLIAKAEASSDLDWSITTVLKHVDLPQAVTFIARRMAKIDVEIEGTDRFNLFASTSDRLWSRDDRRQQMSVRSKVALKEVWDDRTNEKWLRIRAFGLWEQTITSVEVVDLRRLENDDVLSDRALRARLENGDATAVPLLRGRLTAKENKRNDYWWYQARKVGLDELTDLVEGVLNDRRTGKLKTYKDGGTETDHILAELLMDRRDEFSERMILKHWDHLSTSREYVEAALYIATPALVTNVADVVGNSDKPHQWFKFLFMHWGDRTVNRPGIIDQSQIEVLEPYVTYLDDLSLSDLSRACNRMGLYDWRRCHVDPVYFARKDIDDFGNADGIGKSLERLTTDKMYGSRLHYWLKDRQEEGWERTELLAAIANWARATRSPESVAILCAAIRELGNRNDLVLLDCERLASSSEAQAEIENCRYAVKRRSLH